MNELESRLHAWLVKRSAASESRRVRAVDLLHAAVNRLHADLIDVRAAFRSLRDINQIDYHPDLAGLPYTGYVTVTATAAGDAPSSRAWQQALTSSDASAELQAALLPAHELFSDLDEEDMALIIAGLVRIHQANGTRTESFGFSLSAREMLGSSKILDRLPHAAKRILGVASLPSTPRYLVVAGPADPMAVLLIENTTTYEEAVRARLDRVVTLIAAYGYGLNMMSDSAAGWSLVDSLLSGRCEVLNRSGGPHDFTQLLSHPRLFFWGDLDREGLRIALALRKNLPHLRLSALYFPMLKMLQRKRSSHPYAVFSGKKAQQAWTRSGDPLIDELATTCTNRAVDQEALRIERHHDLGARELTHADITHRDNR